MGYRWSIYLVNLDPVMGSEQGKTRPVLVMSDDDINAILPIINILPITSYKQGRKIYPNEVFLEK
jgi:mRNA interferase MazF